MSAKKWLWFTCVPMACLFRERHHAYNYVFYLPSWCLPYKSILRWIEKNYLFFTSYIINWQTSYIWVFFSTRYGWLSLHSCCVIARGWTQDGWQNRWGLFSSFYPLHYSLRHSYGCLTFRRFFIPSHISMRKCGTSHIIMWILIATYCGDCILLQNLRMILFGIEKRHIQPLLWNMSGSGTETVTCRARRVKRK